MEVQHLQIESRLLPQRSAQPRSSCLTCSVCLRVLHGASWVEPGDLIRSLRAFDREAVPRLQPGLCDHCRHELWLRRLKPHEPLAA